jgi:acyl-CoA synthetase (AMP-forming)/AMP-acid ligase II
VAGYLGIQPSDRLISVLPFSFDYGLSQLLMAVRTRATLVLQRSHLPADVCRTLAAERVTVFAAVPPLWIQLVGPQSPFPSLAFPDLRLITNSGGVFPVETIRRYRELTPHTDVCLMYGLSEAFRSTYLPCHLVDEHPRSMGRAIPETEVLVLGDDGRLAGVDEPGELVHRGPTVALGYWRDPEATARVFRPDPFDERAPRPVVYSGDLVRRDARGLLTFVGRRDAMIKSQGYRISPDEAEEALLESGLLREVVVRGEPDAVAGEAVVAYCVPRDPAGFDPEALLAHCRREMPSYMVPHALRVRDALPRTASGKLDRQALRA